MYYLTFSFQNKQNIKFCSTKDSENKVKSILTDKLMVGIERPITEVEQKQI